MVASVSKERRASTSVETYPGTILVISIPKLTETLSCYIAWMDWNMGESILRIVQTKKVRKRCESIGNDCTDTMRCFSLANKDSLLFGIFFLSCTNYKTYHGKGEIPLSSLDGIVNELGIGGHDSRLGNKRRIGSRILRLDLFDRVDVAGVGHHNGVFEKLVVSGRHVEVVVVVLLMDRVVALN